MADAGALFVTSCGTARGKTYVAEKMIRKWRAAGDVVRVLKPVISGFDPAFAQMSDTGILLAAIGEDAIEESIHRISPWRYAAPLSPDMAAALEGRTVPVDEITEFCRKAIRNARKDGARLLIEGAGGVMVPLDARRTMRDLMVGIDLPVVLVVGSYLGSLSHALTAIEALHMRNIQIERIVVNEAADSNISLNETRNTLARFVDDVPLEVCHFNPPAP